MHPNHPHSSYTYSTDAQSNQISYSYDTLSNLHTVIDQLASQNSATINHNANGTISSVVDFNGNTTSYTYDTNGNLTKITPPTIQSGQGTQLGPTNITPDSLSRPGTIQDGKGQNTVYTYDALDRTHVITYADTSVITNTFDLDGNLTSMVDNTGTTSFNYDALNRQTQKTLPGYTGTCPTIATGILCYTYDGASNLTGYVDGSAALANCNGMSVSVTVCYNYNTLNELSSLVDPATKTTTFGYDNIHHRTTTTYPGNTVVTNTYDNAQRITSVTAVNPSNVTVLSHAYSYTNPATNTDSLLIYRRTENDSVRNLVSFNSFSALNRLTRWCVMPDGSTACNTTPRATPTFRRSLQSRR